MLLALLCSLYIYGSTVKTAGEPSWAPQPTPAPVSACRTEIVLVPTLTPASTVTPCPVPTPTVRPTPFSFVWFSDTQVYPYKYPKVFAAMTDWVVQHQAEHNILAVLHTGDIIDDRTLARHWQNASSAIVRLAPEVPFYCVAGNHDVGATQPDYESYLSYDFCAAKDPRCLYRGGVCWAEPLSAGGTDFLLLGIGWQEGTDYLGWVEQIMADFPDRVVILLVHSFLSTEGKLTENGRLVEREIVAKYEGVRLVLCGHNRGSARWSGQYGKRTVHALMYNFQDDQEKGLGYLRILMFNPLTRNIALTTYSPWLDQFNYQKDTSLDTFTLRKAF